MANQKTEIYHERQKLQFCLVHSLNNLFQLKDAFTRASLNAISENLNFDDPNKEKWTPLSALFRPHHNAITGNYDINVLISALDEKGKRVVWHDRRNGASSIDLDSPDDALMGIVLNIPVRQFGGLWRSRHWVTMKRIDGVWYNLDSDLRAPQSFKNIQQVREFLDYIISLGGEVLLVMNDKELLVRAKGSHEWGLSNVLLNSAQWMTTRGSNRVVHRPDHGNAHPKQDGGGKRRLFSGNYRFRPLRFLKRFGYKVVTALRWKSKGSHEGRSKAAAPPPDPLRSEAIEDCIQFINNSSFTKHHLVSAS